MSQSHLGFEGLAKCNISVSSRSWRYHVSSLRFCDFMSRNAASLRIPGRK